MTTSPQSAPLHSPAIDSVVDALRWAPADPLSVIPTTTATTNTTLFTAHLAARSIAYLALLSSRARPLFSWIAPRTLKAHSASPAHTCEVLHPRTRAVRATLRQHRQHA